MRKVWHIVILKVSSRFSCNSQRLADNELYTVYVAYTCTCSGNKYCSIYCTFITVYIRIYISIYAVVLNTAVFICIIYLSLVYVPSERCPLRKKLLVPCCINGEEASIFFSSIRKNSSGVFDLYERQTNFRHEKTVRASALLAWASLS